VGVQGHRLAARNRRQQVGRVSPRREERSPVDADVSLLPADRRQHHVQQDGALAEHDGAVQRILSTYFERWQFRHPKPRDFFDVATEVAGRDLTGFFDQVYRSSNVFDYGVSELSSNAEGSQYHTSVVVRRYGEAIFPVDVAVTFKDGSSVREKWNGRDRWKLYSYLRPQPAASAVVDPERVLLLDVNVTNNSQTLTPAGGKAATKWAVKWMVWLQDHLLTWAFFV
jgi:hypothetical protein